MAKAAVEEILDKINQLSEAERLLLEQRFMERAASQWLSEVVAAGDLAHQCGIDQAAIDRAVDEVRYPHQRALQTS